MPLRRTWAACPALLTEGQVSDYKGAAILQHLLPEDSIFWQTEDMMRCGCGSI